MKFSSKVEKCGQSPMRKFHPYAVAAKARGIKVYHLNIGQPDVQTPPAFFEAIRKFEQPVLEYAPSPGIPELIDAIKGYYDKLDMHFDKSEIYITTGGSEALSITLQCILDDGDEILIPEPFYPNYNTMVRTCGASITPIPTCPEEGYHYAEREKIEPLINEHTRAIMATNPDMQLGVFALPINNNVDCTRVNLSVSTTLAVHPSSDQMDLALKFANYVLDDNDSSALFESCSFNPLATCHTYEPASWVADASAYVSEGRCYKDLVLPSAVTDEQGRLLQEYYVGSVTKDEIIQRLDEVYAQAIAG